MEQRSSSHNTTVVEKKRSNSTGEGEEVRILGISEYLGATQCLAEAFACDLVARYFLDTDDMKSYSEEYKWKLHYDIIRYVVAAHCYNGMVTTIGPDYDAVALWMPPGKNMDDWWTILRSGMWRLFYKLSHEGKQRFYGEFLPLLHNTKHEVLGQRDDDSYYLVYIGTKPSARGKGYAKKLIEHGARMADAEGRPIYLESSADVNVAYYTKLGFDLKKEIQLVRGPQPIPLHIMVKEPTQNATIGSSNLKGGTRTSERAL